MGQLNDDTFLSQVCHEDDDGKQLFRSEEDKRGFHNVSVFDNVWGTY
jgi:hypothetical protein